MLDQNSIDFYSYLSKEDRVILQDAITGARGPHQKRISAIGLSWIITLLKKNHDYGSTIFDSPCLRPHLDPGDAILVRASDKISRVAQLTQMPNLINESLEDSLRDLGAYCLLYLCRDINKNGSEKTDNQAS